MVTDSAVSVPVFAVRSCSSLNHGLLVETTGVAVSVPPVPPPVIVSATVVVRDTVPDVAVSVTVAAPSVAVLEAVNVAVTELPVVAVAGLKATVTPVGSPVAAIVTAPVKLVRLIAIVEAPLAPRATDNAPGDEPTVKSLVAVPVTVSATVVVRVSEPEVAVSVIVAAPRVAVLEAVNVVVTELPVVAVAGLNATVTPAGNPLAAMLTAPVKLVRLIATLVEALALRWTETGLTAPSVKSAVAATLSVAPATRDSVPEVPVTDTCDVPRVAVLDAVKVTVTEFPVTGVDGVNVAVTPLGSEVAVNVTGPVKLLTRRMLIMAVVLEPRVTPMGLPELKPTSKSPGNTAVAVTGALAAETLPEPSTARTVYVYVWPLVTVES